MAAQAATLEAKNENITRYQQRIQALEGELAAARRRNDRLVTAIVFMTMAFITLAIVYIWDVRNLHSGLTAFFNP